MSTDLDPFPMPGTKINDMIVIASVYYRESDDELVAAGVPGNIYTVLCLRPDPPFFRVMTLYRATSETSQVAGWHIENSQDHHNIVPAVNGDKIDGKWLPGYVDMGGDY